MYQNKKTLQVSLLADEPHTLDLEKILKIFSIIMIRIVIDLLLILIGVSLTINL